MIDALGRPQRILLVGGTSDIGLEIVEALASSHTQVVLAGRDGARLQQAASRVSRRCSGADIRILDIAQTADVATALSDIFADEVDMVIIAAGVLPDQTAAVADPAVAVQSLAVNGLGAAAALAHCHALMCAQGHGQVVVLSTIAAARPRPGNYIYGAGKSMLDFLARGMVESPDPRVRVLLVRPGFVRTRMTRDLSPAPFAVTAAAVAAAVAAWSRTPGGSSVVWVPGVLKHVARVLALLPLALLRKVDR